ncbi:hypothetical protein FB451DRAFT_1523632 [Mycena latifolia]|nr:hypothetical protein FB451DRAFT_1523632 [Mycena latifolia]
MIGNGLGPSLTDPGDSPMNTDAHRVLPSLPAQLRPLQSTDCAGMCSAMCGPGGREQRSRRERADISAEGKPRVVILVVLRLGLRRAFVAGGGDGGRGGVGGGRGPVLPKGARPAAGWGLETEEKRERTRRSGGRWMEEWSVWRADEREWGQGANTKDKQSVMEGKYGGRAQRNRGERGGRTTRASITKEVRVEKAPYDKPKTTAKTRVEDEPKNSPHQDPYPPLSALVLVDAQLRVARSQWAVDGEAIRAACTKNIRTEALDPREKTAHPVAMDDIGDEVRTPGKFLSREVKLRNQYSNNVDMLVKQLPHRSSPTFGRSARPEVVEYRIYES